MFKVIGLDQWLRYTNIDFEYYENLGLMIPTDGYIDYSKLETQKLVQKYHKRYEVFPEKFAIQGFDVTYFYLKTMNKFN